MRQPVRSLHSPLPNRRRFAREPLADSARATSSTAEGAPDRIANIVARQEAREAQLREREAKRAAEERAAVEAQHNRAIEHTRQHGQGDTPAPDIALDNRRAWRRSSAGWEEPEAAPTVALHSATAQCNACERAMCTHARSPPHRHCRRGAGHRRRLAAGAPRRAAAL